MSRRTCPFSPSRDALRISETSVTSAIRIRRPTQTSLLPTSSPSTPCSGTPLPFNCSLSPVFLFCCACTSARLQEHWQELDCCHWLGCWSAGFGAWACSITPRQPRSLQFTEIHTMTTSTLSEACSSTKTTTPQAVCAIEQRSRTNVEMEVFVYHHLLQRAFPVCKHVNYLGSPKYRKHRAVPI
jgi:hypothetical protein